MIDFSTHPKFEKRNHHYVPQFWQRHFKDSTNQLFKTFRGGVKAASTKSTMSGDFIYIAFDEGWRPIDVVEDQLSLWEGFASKLVDRIVVPNTAVRSEDWVSLCLWLGICACRHPHVLQRYKELAVNYAYDLAKASNYPDVHAMNQQLRLKYGVTIIESEFQRIRATPSRELVAQAEDIEAMPPFDPNLPNTEALLGRNIVANAIYNMDQTLMDAPSGHEFLLGSNPLPNQSLSHGFTVPLSKDVALRCTPPRNPAAVSRGRRCANIFEIGEVNLEQISRSSEAIASSMEILKYWVNESDAL